MQGGDQGFKDLNTFNSWYNELEPLFLLYEFRYWWIVFWELEKICKIIMQK